VLATIATLVPLAQAEDFIQDRSGEASCVAKNDTVCWSWIVDNLGDYVTPLLEHVVLTLVSVALGFAIAFVLAMLSHRRRWLIPPLTATTGILYTLPSIALFTLLLPITGRGTWTAIIALTLYNLQIIYRNMVVGLANVPGATRDAGRGMGMANRQLFWRVELPLATPEIIAGLRIAAVSTVAIATLAVFAGAGGLGAEIYSDIAFKSGIVAAGGLCILLAFVLDLLLVGSQRFLTPWRKVRPV
jgi:osmoprotectant transport system permease protein